MHRGGTSAFAGVIGTLGVPLGSPSAMKGQSPANELGFWEMTPLTRFNDELLALLGGTWASPPPLPDGWHEEPRLEPRRREAANLFADLHPTRQWVWKDPRNSLLLPFWTSVLEVEPIHVICNRNPLEVQMSLAKRDGFPKRVGLALWERYMRSAVRAAAGQPAAVCRYSTLVAEPRITCQRLHGFLEGHGVDCSAGSEDRAAAFLRSELRHARLADVEIDRDPAISTSQRELVSRLTELEGEHDVFPRVDLPPETPETEALLSARRDLELKLRKVSRTASEREAALREKLAGARARIERLDGKLREERLKLRRERQKQQSGGS